MKKFFILSVFILVACSGNTWESKVGVSDLTWSDSYIIGEIQNKTENVLDLTLTVEASNGSIKTDETCYVTLQPNNFTKFDCIALDYNEEYDFTLKNVEIKEYPSFANRDTTQSFTPELFKVYFPKAYELNTSLNLKICGTLIEDRLPFDCTQYVSYYEEKDEAYISNTFTLNNTEVTADLFWNRIGGYLVYAKISINRKNASINDFYQIVEDVRDAFAYSRFDETSKLNIDFAIKESLQEPMEPGTGYHYNNYVYNYSVNKSNNDITDATFLVVRD